MTPIIHLPWHDYLNKCIAECSMDNNSCNKYWMLRKKKEKRNISSAWYSHQAISVMLISALPLYKAHYFALIALPHISGILVTCAPHPREIESRTESWETSYRGGIGRLSYDRHDKFVTSACGEKAETLKFLKHAEIAMRSIFSERLFELCECWSGDNYVSPSPASLIQSAILDIGASRANSVDHAEHRFKRTIGLRGRSRAIARSLKEEHPSLQGSLENAFIWILGVAHALPGPDYKITRSARRQSRKLAENILHSLA
jgi:hypothetical protein